VPRHPLRLLVVTTVLAATAAVLGACGGVDDDDDGTASPTTAIAGVEVVGVGDYTHVRIGEAVEYDRRPPVGGTHWFAPGWAECGFYDQPVPDVAAVHLLEHGVVWVAYRPDLGPDDLAILQQLARTDDRLLVTPYADLRTPIVATAWGVQLALEDAGDGRLVQFVARYTDARTAPEAGASCDPGQGVTVQPVE
jgi:hypothetical protein